MDSSDGLTGLKALGMTRDAGDPKTPVGMIPCFKLRKARSFPSWNLREGVTESEYGKLTHAVKDDGEPMKERPATRLGVSLGVDDTGDFSSESPPLLPATTLRSSSNGSHHNRRYSLNGIAEQVKTPPTSPPRDPIPESIDELVENDTSCCSPDDAMDCDTGAADTITGEPSTYSTALDKSMREDLRNGTEYDNSSAYISPPRSVGSPRVAPSTAVHGDIVNSIACPSIPESNIKTYTPAFSTSDIIKVVLRPKFPVRVRNEIPLAFSPKAQNSKMEWTHERHHFTPTVCWVVEPDIADIRETVWPWLEYLGSEKDSTSISFMAEGGFNKVYAIETRDRATNQKKHYVFRVTLPIDPY